MIQLTLIERLLDKTEFGRNPTPFLRWPQSIPNCLEPTDAGHSSIAHLCPVGPKFRGIELGDTRR